MNLVVSDASPVNYLLLIGKEDILPRLFSKVILPRVVMEQELGHPDSPAKVRNWSQTPPSWIEVIEPISVDKFDLDVGETHAIALALQMHCPVLIDERQARHVAFGLGLKVMGTVGLLEQAAVKGFLDLPEALAQLAKTNARISSEIIRQALARHEQRPRWESPPEIDF